MDPSARQTPFDCDCGEVSGYIDARPPHGATHAACYCADCLRAENAMGQPYPGGRGVALVQTRPDRVHFLKGADRLGILRLSPKGLFRWYATCCGVPLFNTPPRKGVPFASLHAARVPSPEDLGRVRAHLNAGEKTSGIWRAMPPVILRTLAARLSGGWKRTPFFDEDGEPVAKPKVLTREQRAAAAPAGRHFGR